MADRRSYDSPAGSRAFDLLLTYLDPEQRKTFDRYPGYIEVPSRIKPRWVYRIDWQGRVIGYEQDDAKGSWHWWRREAPAPAAHWTHYCIVPIGHGDVPLCDHILGVLLMLRAEEHRFLAVAVPSRFGA